MGKKKHLEITKPDIGVDVLEKETIEHLRWLQNGLHTFGVKTEFNGIEINTPEDLVLWHEKYGNK